MRIHTHNALHVKRKIAPADYKRDPNCTVITKEGHEVVVPAFLIVALREGKIRMKA